MNNDVGYLKFHSITGLPIIPQWVANEMITCSSRSFQNKNSSFASKDGRSMTQSWFRQNLGNGQGDEVKRS